MKNNLLMQDTTIIIFYRYLLIELIHHINYIY